MKHFTNRVHRNWENALCMFVVVGVIAIGSFLMSCATTRTPVETAKITVKVSKDTIVLTQKIAALARDEFLDAQEQEREPQVPYLDDQAWEQYLALEKKIVDVHEIVLGSVKLAEQIEGVDPEKASDYLQLALANQATLADLFYDLGVLLKDFGIELEEVLN